MDDCATREMTKEELIKWNSEIRALNEKLREELKEAKAISEIRYRDGIIYGLKYSVRCNGVSGDRVDG